MAQVAMESVGETVVVPKAPPQMLASRGSRPTDTVVEVAGVKVVFAERQYDPKPAEVVAEQIGARLEAIYAQVLAARGQRRHAPREVHP